MKIYPVRVPLHQPNKDITKFFHYDVKVARDYNKTIHEGDLETNNLTLSTINTEQLTNVNITIKIFINLQLF